MKYTNNIIESTFSFLSPSYTFSNREGKKKGRRVEKKKGEKKEQYVKVAV
jgi:hypothetical protein